MSRLDIVQARTGRDGKTFYTKIGVAWPLDKGGYRLSFEALPIASMNRDGNAVETTALLFPPKDDAQRPARSPAQQGSRGGDSYDSDVPF